MPGTSNIFEILALFAVGALVCWPALRRRFPALQFAKAEPAQPVRRYEPQSARAYCEHARPSAPLAETDIDETFYGGYPDPAADDDHVMPLAEALMRGEEFLDAEQAASGRVSVERAATEAVAAAPAPFKIMVVDRRDKFRTAMLLKLARGGHRVYPVANGREALDLFSRERTDLILIHRESLCEAGADFPKRVRSRAPYVPILVHGGRPGAGNVGKLRHGVDITVISNAGEDADVISDMIDCSLAATRCIRAVQEEQGVRGQVVSELAFDLRSALDVICGYTDILSDDPDLGRFGEMLSRMRESTSSAAATVQMQSDVDSALEIDSGAREERVDLFQLSEKLQQLVERRIGTRPLDLTTSGPIEGSALFTDGEKLAAILSHVIADAARTTPTSAINVAVRSSAEHTDFVVSDAGPSIRSDMGVPYAGDAAPRGVGLTIAERLGRSIGATLSGMQSESGASQFVIRVPSKLMTPSTEAASRLLH